MSLVARLENEMAPRHVFVADLGGSKLSAAIVGRKGKIAARRIVRVDTTSPNAPIHQIRRLATELAAGGGPRKTFVAAAVAVPGLVRRTGTVWAPNLPGWERMPLAGRLQRFLGIPVIIEGDRNAAVLGEYWQGAARGKTDVIVLIVGTGIGAGILSGDRLVRGAHELSGCAGWMVVSDQRRHDTRRFGQLEALTAGPAIARAAKKALSRGKDSLLRKVDVSKITAYEVAAAARRGDALSVDLFRDVGQHLGRAVANLVSLLDPQIVIIGGGLANASDLFMDSLNAAVHEHAQPIAAKQVRVTTTKLDADANLLGCAYLAWKAAKETRLARMKVSG